MSQQNVELSHQANEAANRRGLRALFESKEAARAVADLSGSVRATFGTRF